MGLSEKKDRDHHESSPDVMREAALPLIDSRAPLFKKMERLMETLRDHLKIRRMSLAVLDREEESLWAVYSPRTRVARRKIPLSSSLLAAEVFRSSETALVGDIAERDDPKSMGEFHTVSCVFMPLKGRGKTIGVAGFADPLDADRFTDERMGYIGRLVEYLGDYVENARVLDRMKRDLERTRKENKELKRLMDWRAEATQMIVHDLKTPINETLGNLDLLREEPLSELGVECLDSALLGCDSLMRMVTNILDVSRMQSKKMMLKPEPKDLIALAQAAILGTASLRALNNVRVEETWSEAPMRVIADENLIKRTLINLLENAAKFSPEGEAIRITGKTDQGYRVIEVEDQGPGIPADLRRTIFDSYVSGPSAAQTIHSYGLGLAMCRLAAELHGGDIAVVSEPGMGSRFILRLPMNSAGEDAFTEQYEELEKAS